MLSLNFFIGKLIFCLLISFFPAKQRAMLLDWLNNTLPDLSLPLNASDEDLRMCLNDGTVLCRLLSRLRPGFVKEVVESFFHFSLLPSYAIKWNLDVKFQLLTFIFHSRKVIPIILQHVQRILEGFWQWWMTWGSLDLRCQT